VFFSVKHSVQGVYDVQDLRCNTFLIYLKRVS
jgi:hypothetical protein